MRRIVTISFTGLDAPGGVPRWNRDFHSAFLDRETVHYSWQDVLPAVGGKDNHAVPEWDKARVLNQWLIWKKNISKDDIIFVDGFWGLGLEQFPDVISICHGNWSHTTADDVVKGIPPEFPDHHRVQLRYRQDHRNRGGRLVACSEFIAHQCDIQWGLKFPVINNGIDLEKFSPKLGLNSWEDKKLIIHGTTTQNKGFDHIEAVKRAFPNDDVLLLDEAAKVYRLDKYKALASANLVVHPSAHEGNSYFVLETLACNVPIVSYDVGLMYQAEHELAPVGFILDRKKRSPEKTVWGIEMVLFHLALTDEHDRKIKPREWVSKFSLENFRSEWRAYVKAIDPS